MIAERAARSVLKEAGAPAGDVDALKRGFEELKALHAAAEKKTQATLKAVHNALETLVGRLPGAPAADPTSGAPLPEGPVDPASARRLEAAVRKLHRAATSQAEEIVAGPADAPAEMDEVLLEPGTPRPAAPVAAAATSTAAPEGDPGAVRANFIAAARRAAQAASAEAAGRPKPEEAAADGKPPISNQTLIERIRQTFDSHRRPLLLSTAALMLAAGAAQITRAGREPASPAVAAAEPAAEAPAPPAAAPAPAVQHASLDGIALPAALPPSLRAAEAGDLPALHELATRLAEGRGLPRDAALAAKLFARAAEAGLAPAQFRLGHLNEKGIGVPKNPAEARVWYARAAEAGHVQAMHNLAVLLAEGVEGRADYAAASRWFTAAAEHGLKDSQFNLAVLLARGLGVKQDLKRSYLWFALAARQGDADAAAKRDEVGARLGEADRAAAQAELAGWQARAADPAANEVPAPAEGVSALAAGRAG
jgi:localization factor PodJL